MDQNLGSVALPPQVQSPLGTVLVLQISRLRESGPNEPQSGKGPFVSIASLMLQDPAALLLGYKRYVFLLIIAVFIITIKYIEYQSKYKI